MQSTARKNELPLDKMCLVCEVTKKATREEIPAPPRDGAYTHGLFMEVYENMESIYTYSFCTGGKVGY